MHRRPYRFLFSLSILVFALGAIAADEPDGAWLSEVERRITQAEYEITWQTAPVLEDLAASWHAPNRAQGFRTYFTKAGIRLVPRTAEGPSWEWSLSVIGWGRPGAVQAVGAAVLRPGSNRIEYDRDELVEWYVNEARGLEQGFTLAGPPESGAEDAAESTEPSEVWIELALGGTLRPVISTDGQAIDFAMSGGAPAIHYAHLEVADATGRVLPARMEGFPGGIRLVFEDEDAVYPVTVDPLATTAAWTDESDQADAHFGYSVATAGDVNGDGYSDVIVGAYRYDNGEAAEGQAYLYLGSASGLSAVPDWMTDSDQANAELGRSVATAGDVNDDGYSDVIVGAYLYTNGESDEGRAYVYLGSAAGLLNTADWEVEGDQADANFGRSVATAGDVNGDGYSDVIVGANGFDNGGTDGRAYVYHGSAAGLSEINPWIVESDQALAEFGYSVASAGDVNGDGYSDVIVGASAYANGQAAEGSAFVYHGSAAGLSAVADWTEESDQANAGFGISVATAGDVNGDGYSDVIVGAHTFNSGLVADAGRAYVYLGSAAGLSHVVDWRKDGDQPGTQLGVSVAAAGDVNGDGYSDVIVGASLYTNGEADEGRAYVYLGSAAGLSNVETWTEESDQAEARFGISVATAGDVNGDGYSDVIVGAYLYDDGETAEGRAYVYLGSAAGLSTDDPWTAEADQGGAFFGLSAATAGDVNGDGYSDVIVGAWRYDNPEEDEGRAYLYLGSAAGLSEVEAWTAESDQACPAPCDGQGGNEFAARFGVIVGTAGDVNGDGYSDVIVGAYGYNIGDIDEGRAYVYLGSAAGLSDVADWIADGDQAGGLFGDAAATAGDVNGDGYSDVIVGATAYDNPETNEGRAFVYHGSAAGLSDVADWTADGDQANAIFGWPATTAGDVNGDGYSDVIIGASHYSNPEFQEGRAYVYLGSAAGLSDDHAWMDEGDQVLAQFGWWLATAGDVNGDGYSDVIVAAWRYDNPEADEGGAWVYLGSAAGLSDDPDWMAEGDQVNARLGRSVATAGDVNGDGYSDVIVGAFFYTNGESQEGRAYLYYGNDGAGLSLRPEQRNVADTVPIEHLGRSDGPDGFRLALLGRSPYGRGLVKLEWEVKPLGTLFDGTGTSVSSSWMDTGTTGTALNELVSGLADDTLYHWRVRLLYDSVTVPFQQASRWLTAPRAGWQESKLRTAGTAAAGSVDSLLLGKAGAVPITLSWGASCSAGDVDYEIYEGTVGDFASHTSKFCSTAGQTTKTLTPLDGNTYYLVVPRNSVFEGSYGTDSDDAERPQGLSICLEQLGGACR